VGVFAEIADEMTAWRVYYRQMLLLLLLMPASFQFHSADRRPPTERCRPQAVRGKLGSSAT